MRQSQLHHENEIMRLKEQISDAQRFVHYSLITVCNTCPREEFIDVFITSAVFVFACFSVFVCWLVGIKHICNFLFFRSNIQENVDLIKLQRDMKEKATKFEALQVKYLNLEEVRYQ